MKALRIAVVVLGLVLAAMIGFYLWSVRPPRELVPVAPQQPAVSPAAPEPEIHYPLPEAESVADQPLPELAASDPYMKQLLSGLYDDPELLGLLIPRYFIQRLVLIVDALPRKSLPLQHLPLFPPKGTLQVAEDGERIVIGAGNPARYAPYVELAEAVPVVQLTDAYVKIYPLLQDAYRETGHPQGYFNDRMIVVLDHLLAAPQVDAPIVLKAHVKRYLYADPTLEALSAGHKILLRMGPANARRVKRVLQALRDRLVALAAPGQAPDDGTR